MKINFGKYVDHNVSDIAKTNPSYLYTLLNNTEDEFKSGSFYQHALEEIHKGEQEIPLGKYKGTKIKDLDEQYMKWLYPKLEDGWLKSVIGSQIFTNPSQH
jgi:uncharacterized protein (DUF3820 family)